MDSVGLSAPLRAWRVRTEPAHALEYRWLPGSCVASIEAGRKQAPGIYRDLPELGRHLSREWIVRLM